MPAAQNVPATARPKHMRIDRNVLVGRVAPVVCVLLLALWLACRWRPPVVGRLLCGGWRAGDVLVTLSLLWLGGFCWATSAGRRVAFRWLAVTLAGGGAWLTCELVVACMPPREEPVVLGWVPVPNVHIVGRTAPDIAAVWGLPHQQVAFDFETNQWGFRNPKGLTEAEIYCIGDSMLVGIQVPRTKTIPGQIEALAGRSVGNISLIGKAPQQMQQHFRKLDLDLKGRIVLQFLCEDNDLPDSEALGGAPPPPDLPTYVVDEGPLANRLLLYLQRLTQPEAAQARLRRGSSPQGPVWFLWNYDRGSSHDAQVPVILESLRQLDAYVRGKGGHFGVVLLPAKLRVIGPLCTFPPDSILLPMADHLSPLPEALARWSAETGVPCLDPTVALIAVGRGGQLPWFADDTHLTEVGNRVVAEAIRSWDWFAALQPR